MRQHTLRMSSTAIAIATMALSAGTGMAQDAVTPPQPQPPAGTANTSDQTGLPSANQDIVVTARKRTESLLKVPEAISVFQGDSLKTLGVQSVSDIQNLAPGVNIGRDGFGVNINIRGVTTTDTTSKGEQGISYNVDGIVIGRPIEQGLAFFDIQRVEILRGPQGTLYGQSSTGGAINVITNKPIIGSWSGYAKVENGNYDTERAEGAINIPIASWLAIRAAGDVNHREGYFVTTNGTRKGDEKDETGRISALAQIFPDLTARVTVTGGHVGGAGAGAANLGNVIDGNTKQKFDVLDDPFPAKLADNFTNVNGEIDYTAGPFQLTYVGAYLHYKAHDQSSSNNDPLGNYQGPPPAVGEYAWRNYRGTINTDQQEFRVNNANSGLLEYTVGANYYKERITESDHNWSALIFDPTYAGSFNGIDPVNTTTHYSFGVFGQATAHVTSTISIVGGIRYSHDKVERIGTFASGPGPFPNGEGGICTAPNDNCIGASANGLQKAGKVTYKGGVNWQITPDNLLYAQIASGYKAGGFNDYDPKTLGTGTYAPENLVAYEAGYKGRPLRNLQFTSSLFYYDYKAQQISSLVNIVGNFVIFTRLASSTIYGWENEATWNVARHTSLGVSAAYEHSRYDRFSAGINQNIDWHGLSLDKTPAIVATATLNQAFELQNGWELRFRAFTKFSTHYILSDISDAYRYRQSSFTRSDVSLTLAAPEDRWYIQGFIQNLENKVQAIGAVGTYNAAFLNGSSLAISEPRLYGVRVGVNFK